MAGVVGVGVAYPLDALKTKTQIYASSRPSSSTNDLSMIKMAYLVQQEEGLKGFYGGVLGVMIGEAFVKAVLFGSNFWALSKLTDGNDLGVSASILQLVLAAAFSGFSSSFVLNPIERVKILMQTDSEGLYSSEIECITAVIKKDGLSGLVFRGLDAMMAREIPGCVVYFMTYSLLMKIMPSLVGSVAPFICGGTAGICAWIPIYPSDVIKTNMQSTEGSGTSGMSFIETALTLQRKFGLGIFFDGIQPKLLRAAVNHSVTFFVYDLIVRSVCSKL